MKKRMLSNYQPILPCKLQFFAEEKSTSTENSTDSVVEETKDSQIAEVTNATESSEEKIDYQAKYVESESQKKKLKADLDSALKRLGDTTKQLRAKMTEQELQAEQKAQEDEEKKAYVTELENYKKTNEAIKRYQLQGMSNDLAEKAAKAEIDGDMDALADIQAQHTKNLIKEKEAEWKASRPRVNMGDGEDASMTKEEIFAIKDPKERQIAIAKNLKLFENH